jgi:TrmH family RNA methyltransferase
LAIVILKFVIDHSSLTIIDSLNILAPPSELDRVRVVLVGARNPLNIGAAARAMSNFGFSHLRVVNAYDEGFREARSAVGASSILASAEQCSTVAEAIGDCTLVVGTTAVRHRELQHQVKRLEEGGSLLKEGLRSGNVAILFGSEKFGLSNEHLSYCHWLMRIPTCDDNISMNLGQAVAVCLYELIRSSHDIAEIPSHEAQVPPASVAEVERITEVLIEVLHASEYLERRIVRDAEERLRRLVRRLNLPARDAVIWLGILRQVLWKLKSNRKP